MMNPFDPPNLIFLVNLPNSLSKVFVVVMMILLLLKNMINALFSSKEGGTKSVLLSGITFDWKAVTMMYERECDRVGKKLTRIVPKLKGKFEIRGQS